MRTSRRACMIVMASVSLGYGCSSSGLRTHDGGTAPSDAGAPKDAMASNNVDRPPLDSATPDTSSYVPDTGRADASQVDARAADVVGLSPEVARSDAVEPPFEAGGLDDSSKPVPDGESPDKPYTTTEGGTAPDVSATANDIIRSCALAASCAGYGSPYSTSACISEFSRTVSRQDDSRLNRLLTCANTHDCSQFRSCWGGNLFTLDTFVINGQCRGSSLFFTAKGASNPLQWDCGVMGGDCVDPMTDIPRAGCEALPCGSTPSTSCDGTTASGCSINTMFYTSVDCARSGRACQMVGRDAVCGGTGAVCASSEKVTCAGSVATYCSGGARATIDCASTGLATHCAEGASPSEPCAAAGTECNLPSFVDQCDGSTLKVCANGFIVPVECSSIGFGLCLAPSDSNSYAHCHT